MRNTLALTSILAGLALTGCNQAHEVPDPGEASLLRLSSCDALRDYANDVMLESILDSRYGYYGRGWGVDDAEMDAGASNDEGGPSDFTTTNVQEEGVDELDIVKTDGKYIYVAQDRGLHIVKSWPVEESEKLATVPLDGWVRGLFLKDDKVVVFYMPNERGTERDWSWGLRARVYDVTDRTAPELEREIDIQGWMADARMIDGDVYMVVNHQLQIPEAAWNLVWDNPDLQDVQWGPLDTEASYQRRLERAKADARAKIAPKIRRIANDMRLDEWLPSWEVDGAGPELLHDCTDLYRPTGVGQHGAMSILNLDLDSGDVESTGLLSNGWQLYASKDNLYVAQSSRWWWWGGWDRELETHIHKFSLGKEGEPFYAGSGEVRGWAYDQFAFSEFEGKLRVATTDADWWGSWNGEEDDDLGANNVFVLDDTGSGLSVVGELGGIAPGERIFATRFFGKKAYMVTFRQVDPLFTIDLSDPTAPEVLGELKIPGYSAYLHPMGDDHLLAVGMDGTDEGQLTGLAFNIFDVSDPANPTLAHQHTLAGSDWSWSEALFDHHAFTYHRDVLTVPMFEYHDGRRGEDRYFSGSISLNATPESGFDVLGRVDHRPLVADSECLWSRWYDYNENICGDSYWYARVRRSVYIEDNLFTLSDYGVRVTDLNDPSVEHARVLFYPDAD